MTCEKCRAWRSKYGRKTPCDKCEMSSFTILPQTKQIEHFIDAYGETFIQRGKVSNISPTGISVAMEIEGIENKRQVYQGVIKYLNSYLKAIKKKEQG